MRDLGDLYFKGRGGGGVRLWSGDPQLHMLCKHVK